MSKAEIRSVATKRRVVSSMEKISRTLPLAIFFNPEDDRSKVVRVWSVAISLRPSKNLSLRVVAGC